MPKAKASSKASPARDVQATSRARLLVEIAGDEPAWTCLDAATADAAVAAIANAIAANVQLPAATTTATLVLGTDHRVRSLNHQWRQQDKPTNVLSFPSGESPPQKEDEAEYFAGDVIIAEETLVREAGEQVIPVSYHFHHLALHGLLHLLGYDHEIASEAEAMEALETKILASLGIPDPYADTEPDAAAHAPRSQGGASRR